LLSEIGFVWRSNHKGQELIVFSSKSTARLQSRIRVWTLIFDGHEWPSPPYIVDKAALGLFTSLKSYVQVVGTVRPRHCSGTLRALLIAIGERRHRDTLNCGLRDT